MREIADDASHMSSHNLTSNLLIQRDVNNISVWCGRWSITHNEIKTVHMVVSRRTNASIIKECQLNNVDITAVN
jgi:hypothetical protein